MGNELRNFYEEQIEWYKKQLIFVKDRLDYITEDNKWNKRTYGFIPYETEKENKKLRQMYYRNRKYYERKIKEYTYALEGTTK